MIEKFEFEKVILFIFIRKELKIKNYRSDLTLFKSAQRRKLFLHYFL